MDGDGGLGEGEEGWMGVRERVKRGGWGWRFGRGGRGVDGGVGEGEEGWMGVEVCERVKRGGVGEIGKRTDDGRRE